MAGIQVNSGGGEIDYHYLNFMAIAPRCAQRQKASWLTDKTPESPIKPLLRLANRIRA